MENIPTSVIAVTPAPTVTQLPYGYQPQMLEKYAGLYQKNNDLMNNLSGSASELALYAYGADGKLLQAAPELWKITDENGQAVDTLEDGALYELRVVVADNGAFDLNEAERAIKVSVVLGK